MATFCSVKVHQWPFVLEIVEDDKVLPSPDIGTRRPAQDGPFVVWL